MVFLQEEDYLIPYEYQPTHQSGKRMGDLHCWNFTTAHSLSACCCSPRGETVIIRYRALSAYHRLAFPGLCISILQLANCFNLTQTMVVSSSPVITDSDGDPTLLLR